MVLLFYVDECLMFSPSKYKIDGLYASLQEDFNLGSDVELNKYIGMDMDRHSDGSIYMRQPYLTQRILSMIPEI